MKNIQKTVEFECEIEKFLRGLKKMDAGCWVLGVGYWVLDTGC